MKNELWWEYKSETKCTFCEMTEMIQWTELPFVYIVKNVSYINAEICLFLFVFTSSWILDPQILSIE